MRPLAVVLASLALGALAPRSAGASPSVTLNGVNIDGVTAQRFENCTVVIDEKGDIHIDAKGYAVKSTEGTRTAGPTRTPSSADARPPPAGRVTRRYFLAAEQTAPGTQYDLGVFVNAKWVREVKANEMQVVMEITKYLVPGPNKITLAATKRIVGDRLSYDKGVVFKIVIGEGNVGGDHVMIDVPLVETQRTAAEVEDKTEEFVVEAR